VIDPWELDPGDLEIEVEIPEPDEILDDDVIDPEDRVGGYLDVGDREPAPEFADFDAWCPDSEDWVALWRPTGEVNSPWFCRNCGGTDHQFRDHEGGGA
jgi:hypothetical protein